MTDDLTQRAPGSSHHTAALSAELPPEVKAASANPANRFGKYVLVRELGHGGMGVVYLAWQSDLRRYVALKFIKGIEGADDLARFEREARTSAALVHPNIVPVYEVGELEGKHYYSMMFVRGKPLDALLRGSPPPGLRSTVEWIAGALDAVQFANEQGVIHRDIKPANLMIGDDGRVYVMDFGLARWQNPGSSLTASGLAVGTPAYMSPEQAGGRVHGLDGRSDVYSFGATLYEAIAGRPPFEGTGVTILLAVTADDPLPPRRLRPELPPDLEIICLRAMAKDPARRYATCRDFAADLRRWLDGEPILAKPEGAVSRAVRRVRKHKLLSAAVGVAALSLIAGSGVVAYSQVRLAQERARQADRDALRLRIGEVIAAIERWDAELLKPAHDITATWPQLQGYIRRLEELRGGRPDLPEVDYAAGKALRRMDRPNEAVERFSAALRSAPNFAPALYERGRTRLDTVLRFEKVHQPSDRARAPEPPRDVIATALHDLSEAVRLGGISEDELVLASALIDTHGLHEEQAVMRCTAVIEAGRVDADVLRVRGLAHVMYGTRTLSLADARKHLGLGLADLTAAADIRRSDYEILNSLAHAHVLDVWIADDAGEDTLKGAAEVARISAIMRRVHPSDLRAALRDMEALDHVINSLARRNGALADYARRRSAAIDEYERLGGDPLAARFQRATVEARLSEVDLLAGRDARGRIDRTIAAFEALIADGCAFKAVWVNAASLLQLRIRLRMARGDLKVEDDYERGLELLRHIGETLGAYDELAVRADLHSIYADALERAGRDSTEFRRAALADLKSATDRGSENPKTWTDYSRALFSSAEREAATGGDPAARLADALQAVDRALAINGTYGHAWNIRGLVHQLAGNLDAALADLDRAVGLMPDFGDPVLNRGNIWFARAQAALYTGADPSEPLDKAQRDYDTAARLSPGDPTAHMNSGIARSMRAQWLHKNKKDASSELEAAEKSIRESLRLNPNYAEAHAELGSVLQTRAGAEAAAGRDPIAGYRAAIDAFSRSLELKPDHLSALNNRGTVYNDLVRAYAALREMKPASDACRSAIEDFSAVIKANPKDWQARANRATSWRFVRQYGRAADDLEAAAELNPAMKERFATEIDRLRKLAGE